MDINRLKVTCNQSLREALTILNDSAAAVLLLVDNSGRLLRTITDGDIRRLLLSGHDLDSSLDSLPEKVPVTVSGNVPDDIVLSEMNQHSVHQIPVVDEDGVPIAIKYRNKLVSRIELSIPHLGEYERQYVEEAFTTNWIAPLGPNVDAFEREICEYTGAEAAVALSSGTAAIHLALRLLGVENGDIVLCSSFTFVASANPILYQGAKPVFIDSEPSTWNMSPIALEAALTDLQRRGEKKPKAIIVVHLYGQSADMDAIMELAHRYEIPVVEDAAESLGATYKGQFTGTIGEFGVFSFNGNKIITTSGGGMLLSNNKEMVDRARFLATQARDPAPHYQHSEVGYNYRMSNVLAGIGRGQLQVLNERVAARRNIFDKYYGGLSDIPCIEWMPEPEGDFSNRWLSAIKIKNPDKSSKGLIAYLAENNIEARHVWKPMHMQPLFNSAEFFSHYKDYSIKPVSEELFETGICLPSGSKMEQRQQDRVIQCIRDYFC